MILVNNRPILVNSRPLIVSGSPEPPVPSDEVQIGNQIWKTTYLNIDDGQGGIDRLYIAEGVPYFYTYEAATRICTANYPGWRVANNTDYNTLISYCGIDYSNYANLFGTAWGGNDTCGLNLMPMGCYANGTYYGSWLTIGACTSYRDSCLYLFSSGTTGYYLRRGTSNSISMSTRGNLPLECIVRLIKDAT